jgi:hypothetical protein
LEFHTIFLYDYKGYLKFYECAFPPFSDIFIPFLRDPASSGRGNLAPRLTLFCHQRHKIATSLTLLATSSWIAAPNEMPILFVHSQNPP